MLPGGDRPDFLDVDLAGDHVVTETDHDLREQFEPVAPFVRDQDAQVLEVGLHHVPGQKHPILLPAGMRT